MQKGASPAPLETRRDWRAIRRQLDADGWARPASGKRDYRVAVRHGVSSITRGERTTLGIIFNNA